MPHTASNPQHWRRTMSPSAVAVWLHGHRRLCGWKFVPFPKLQNGRVDYKTSLQPTSCVFELSISDPQQTPTHWLRFSDIRKTAHYFLTCYKWGAESQDSDAPSTGSGHTICPLNARRIHLQPLCVALFSTSTYAYKALYSHCDLTTFSFLGELHLAAASFGKGKQSEQHEAVEPLIQRFIFFFFVVFFFVFCFLPVSNFAFLLWT